MSYPADTFAFLDRIRSEKLPTETGCYWIETDEAPPFSPRIVKLPDESHIDTQRVVDEMYRGMQDLEKYEGVKWTGPLPTPDEIERVVGDEPEKVGLRVGVDDHGFLTLLAESGREVARQAGVTYEVYDAGHADVQQVTFRVLTDPRFFTDAAKEKVEAREGDYTVEEHREAQMRAQVPRTWGNWCRAKIRSMCFWVLWKTHYSMFS